MTAGPDDYAEALRRASGHALDWLGSLQERRIPPAMDADEIAKTVGGPLPDDGLDPADVVDLLAAGAEPGLMAMGSGRFFGWVIGGTLPAGLAADWMVSAWDQNAGMRYATPAAAALEEAAGGWLLDLLGLPPAADVGFVTGAAMANFTGLASGRFATLRAAGWDVHERGLTGSPPVHVLVGRERHATVDLALRMLGLGAPTPVDADDQGRVRADRLAEAPDPRPARRPGLLVLHAREPQSGALHPV